MSKRKLYLYNPETDNFERYFPGIKDRLKWLGVVLLVGLVIAVGIYVIIFYSLETPTVENLKVENSELRRQYEELDRRIGASMKVMNEIQDRDSNFYRVLMQMEPARVDDAHPDVMTLQGAPTMRNLNDSQLVAQLTGRLDSLDRQLLHQAMSFNTIRDEFKNQQHKIDHIPSVLPINIKDYTMSSGYGIRIDPVYGSHKFHAGLDFAARTGTQVFATADGRVSYADQKIGYGNCVDIDHGYNYMTRYAHLSKILVPNGKTVKRGELIGLVGSTGKSTGPHLHYEVRYKDEPQNPVNYYFMDLTPAEYDEMIIMAENAGHVMD